jgi:hypothetical protein
VLIRVFGSVIEEIIGRWTNLHSELHNLYPSLLLYYTDQIKNEAGRTQKEKAKYIQNFCDKI